MTRTLIALFAALGMVLATVVPALAYDCFPANKPVGAGSVGVVNPATGSITSSKPNPGTLDQPHGGFGTLSINGTNYDVFAHPPLKAQAPGDVPGINPGAMNQAQKGGGCDGKGLDLLDVCLGG